MHYPASYWVDRLQLQPHVEGGYYKQTYVAAGQIPQEALGPAFHGDRYFSTAIYFLLENDQFSALHRIASDECWHFYAGNGLSIFEIDTNGALHEHLLGNDPQKGQSFQCCIAAGSWFGARLTNKSGYALVGCTVAPAFHFDDFELGTREYLKQQFPQHEKIIQALTRA